MGQLLSSSSTSAHDKAILDLKIQRDRLHQYQKRLDRLVEKETQIAKELVRRGERKKALLTLRKKRYQISLMEKTDGQIFNLEQMLNTIEYKLIERKVIEGLEIGKATLQKLNQEISLDQLDKMMEDSAEAIEYQNQIANALASAGVLSELDDQKIESELDQLLEQENTKLSGKSLDLPDVPNHSVKLNGKSDEVKHDVGTEEAIPA